MSGLDNYAALRSSVGITFSMWNYTLEEVTILIISSPGNKEAPNEFGAN